MKQHTTPFVATLSVNAFIESTVTINNPDKTTVTLAVPAKDSRGAYETVEALKAMADDYISYWKSKNPQLTTNDQLHTKGIDPLDPAYGC